MRRLRSATIAAVAILAAGLAACGRTNVTPAPTASKTPPSPSPTPTSPRPSPSPTASSPAPSPTGTSPSPSPAATATVPSSLAGREWSRLPTSSRVVALTFDGGSNAAGAAQVLAALDTANVPATFFLTGRWVERYPSQSRAIGSTYPVGNHTWSHPHLPQLSDADVRTEVRDAERILASTAGRDPRPLFRFPYGDSDARTVRLINELGYGSFRWTVDTLGWKGKEGGARTTDTVVQRVLGALRPGAIVLMHLGSANDGSTLDAGALPKMIAAIRDRGYGFVTLDRYV